MARKVGFGGGRRSVLGRNQDSVERRSRDDDSRDLDTPDLKAFEAQLTPSRGDGKAAIFLGFTLMFTIPLIFAAIGAYPMLGALSFPERAHEVQAEITGRTAVLPEGEPERVTSITIAYETRIGSRLTTDVATNAPLDIGEQVIVFYDPEAPRYVQLDREVTFGDALDRVGDRIYFTYFALGFICLVLVMLIMVFAGGRKGRR